MAWTDSISDAQLKTKATSAMADGVVKYDEMLGLLNTAKTSGISATEFSDLRLIYQNFTSSFESAYLKAISYDVVYTNPGNAKWWGGTKTASSALSLGDLAAGSSDTKASQLIGKWFLGTDLPMPVAGGDAATGKASTSFFNYSLATGPLFVNGASATDIYQGSIGDCYFVAALGSIANSGAYQSVISNMFVDNGNGTYGVKFYQDGAPAYVTIDKTLPTKTTGKLGGAGNSTKSPTGELWVSLAEKAYAQLNTQFNVNNKKGWTGENSFQAIEGGHAEPFKEVANLNYRYYSSYFTMPDPYKSDEFISSNPQAYKSTIINALNGGALGWLGSFGLSLDATGNANLIPGHAFMLLGYNAATDKFIIRNPWGGGAYTDKQTNKVYPANAQFEESIENIWQAYGVIALTDAALADPVYNYTLSSNAGSSVGAATEGGQVQITVTRSSSGTASTVYLSSIAATANGNDYAAIDKQAVTFEANQTVKTVTIATFKDILTEGVENFSIALFKKSTDTASAASTTVYIKDGVVTDYTYTITTAASSGASAVAEGTPVTFVVTRSGSGTASTVYLTTRSGTAGNTDLATFDTEMHALTFSAYETSKTVTLETYQDKLTEGAESFSLDVFRNIGDATAAATATAYLKDAAAAPAYDYVVTSNAASAATAATEGGKVTFTIMRGGSGSASTVYVSTVAGSGGSADYVGFDKKAVTFETNQTIATVDVDINEDWWLEPNEYFKLALYKSVASTAQSAYGIAYIKDKPVSLYNYTVTSDAADAASAATEGSPVTFTIVRNGSGTASTVYVSTASATAGANDYGALTKQAVSFAANETIKTVTVNSYEDGLTEGQEYFGLDLFRNYTDSTYTAYGAAYLKDAPTTNYEYMISSSASSSGTAVTEGGQVTFTITRSGTGTASTVYVSTTADSAGGSDYAALAKQAITFSDKETMKTVTVNSYQDTLTEGTEKFYFDLFKNYTDSDYSTYATAYIKDEAAAAYTYTVTSSAGTSANAVAENGAITFTITRSGSGSASTVYVSTTANSANATDYAAIAKQAVNFAANETIKTITVDTYQDSVTEGTENFFFDLFKNYADLSYTTYATGYIKDAATANYTYTVSTTANSSANAVTEGGQLNFTITRSGSGSASTVYVSTTANSANSTDYGAISKQAVNFAANETIKTVTINTYQDSSTEGTENFFLDLFKNYTDLSYTTYATGYLKDAATASYTYTVSTTANSSANAVSEGGQITFTITRSGSGSASTVYVSTTANSANSTDYAALNKQAVSFAANETIKTITVDTYQDSATEGTENFFLDLFKNYTDLSYTTYATGYLKDEATANYTYTVSTTANSSANAVSEGSQLTFTITRSGSGSASTVYVSTTANTANSTDYGALSKQAVSFAANETIKTITVDTYQDSSTEGTENFFLDLFKNYTDLSYTTYATGYIKDMATANYTYTVTTTANNTANAVSEGGAITFTITRSGSGSASTVYVSTTANTANSTDYGALSKQAVTFAANETSKTVTVNTYEDSGTEGTENFFLDLFKNYTDLSYTTYTTAYIKDTATANYTYTVSTAANSSANAVSEGSPVTFTITRSGSGSASTVYVSTTANTANSTDYGALSKQAVSFAANETSKTITINTYQDSSTEGTESFFLDLFKNYTDSDYTTYTTGYLKDAATANYTYTVSTTANSSANAVSEGSPITFTITRSGSGSASTVYVTTTANSANSTDYAALSKQAVSFAANETSKTVTINTYQDSSTEGTESFFLDLFKNYTDLSYTTYSTGYLKDAPTANYTYTVSTTANSSANAVSEGGQLTFTITRSGSGSASTVYVTTTANTANSTDYAALSKQAVSFAATETSKTVTVNTTQDNSTEGTENFFLDLFKNYTDTNYSTYATGYIKDAPPSSYTYAVATAAYSPTNAVSEGSPVTFTITRSGSGSASTVYVSTFDFTATTSDFANLNKQAVSFAAGETSKTVSVNTYQDSVAEATEKFYLGLYLNYSDTDYTMTAGFIKDAATAAAPAMAGDFGATAEGSSLSSTPVSAFPNHTLGEFKNGSAFAMVRADGSVVSWGDANSGGDQSAVAAKLDGTVDVAQVYSNYTAFAALRTDGSVVAWGSATEGGNTGSAASQLDGAIDVVRICATSAAFAALRADGSVVTWGDSGYGGDSSAVATQINGAVDVTELYSNNAAFAAVRTNGSVVTWGYGPHGGDSSGIAGLDGSVAVSRIFSTASAFTALRNDGSVITWGNATAGGDSSTVASALNGTIDVTQIASTSSAFAALRADGSVVAWGDSALGGDTTDAASQIDGTVDVTQLCATNGAFAALRTDGSVVTWGFAAFGGDSADKAAALNGDIDVTQICSNKTAFAALRADGSVVTWGFAGNGGDSSGIAGLDGSIDVVRLFSNDYAFAALRADGSVVTWGDAVSGGDSTDVATLLDGTVDVANIFSTNSAFAALRADGTVAVWGDAGLGGDSSTVANQLQSLVGAADIYTNGPAAGTANGDILFGTAAGDSISAMAGNDTLTGGGGNDIINGGTGTDVVAYTGNFSGYGITIENGILSVTDSIPSRDGTDTLYGVEHIRFADATVTLADNQATSAFGGNGTKDLGEFTDNIGQRLEAFYLAYYGRAADYGGLVYWKQTLANQLGGNQLNMASYFGNAQQTEFLNLYGNSGDNSVFIDAVYRNLFNHGADAGGLAYWQGIVQSELQAGKNLDTARAEVVIWILDGAKDSDATAVQNKIAANVALSQSIASFDTGNAYGSISSAAVARNFAGGHGDSVTLNSAVKNVVTELITGSNYSVVNEISTSSDCTLTTNLSAARLTGTQALIVTGNSNDNIFFGNGAGSTMTGGAGGDAFVIGTLPTIADRISDFVTGQDVLILNTSASPLSGLSYGTQTIAQKGSTPSAVPALVYDASTGELSYDPGGSGPHSTTTLVTLVGHPALAGSDVWIV